MSSFAFELEIVSSFPVSMLRTVRNRTWFIEASPTTTCPCSPYNESLQLPSLSCGQNGPDRSDEGTNVSSSAAKVGLDAVSAEIRYSRRLYSRGLAMAMSPDEQTVFKNSADNLSFMRRQQWAITGYAVAAFIALYALTRDKIRPDLVEVLIWFVVAGGILCGYLILRIQFGIASHRRILRRAAKAHFSSDQIRTFGLAYRLPFLREIDFVLCLIAAVAATAAVVIHLWLHP
jgi:hypothetical protein